MSRSRGELAIVLHTHMPYVEGFGTWPFGEEWLWACVAESYLRLEPVLTEAPLTIGITPVLADQFERMRLEDDEPASAGRRMLDFYAESREYVFAEDMDAFVRVGEPELRAALEPQLNDYRRAADRFRELGGDLNAMFSGFAREGAAQLIGGPATHAILPLLATAFGADLQLGVGADSHRTRFGPVDPGGAGIWLPECAVTPGIDRHLARNGAGHFCVDQSRSFGIDSLDNLEPIATPAGPVAVPIDWRTVELVWNERGFPAASVYRSTFNRTVHALMPWDNERRPYDPAVARAQAKRHAGEFLRSVRARLDDYASERDGDGLCVVAVDTELLGHWWYEGPWWLQAVCEQAAAADVRMTTLEDALTRREPVTRELSIASWGERKDLSTWDSPVVADLAWSTRAAELKLFDLLGHHGAGAADGPLLRAARELLALQSSDWAFMDKRRTAGDYARRRHAGHLAAFERAIAAVSQSTGSGGAHAPAEPAGEGFSADSAGLAPGLTPQRLAEIRCAY